MVKYSLFILLILFFIGGCSQQKPQLKDLSTFPQTPYAYEYHSTYPSDVMLKQLHKTFYRHYYAPWHTTFPLEEKEKVLWPFFSYKAQRSYGSNLRPLSQEWFDTMKALSNFESFGTINRYAISLDFVSLRNFPSHKPVFANPDFNGEGFPFDYSQNSGVHANEPLFVSHFSRDEAYVYVFSSYASGWVEKKNIAFITKDQIHDWQSLPQLHLRSDNQALYTLDGEFLFYSKAGMILPMLEENEGEYIARVAIRNCHENVCFKKARIPMHLASKGPLKMNELQLEDVLDGLMSETYGWGGLYEDRDCSSTLRDYFAVFGIWLPRNSYQQSNIGKVIVLEGLSDEEKVQTIIKKGIPYETLLYKRGHIMLYMGVYQNEIAIFHNVWGIHTEEHGYKGRYIIGGSVISSLWFGRSLSDYNEKNSLLSKLKSMNIITEN